MLRIRKVLSLRPTSTALTLCACIICVLNQIRSTEVAAGGLQDAWLRFLSRNGLTSFPMAASPG